MKKGLLILSCVLLSFTIKAQTFVSDSAVMGAGYANDVYISLKNGIVKSASNTNWQLAFRTGLQTDGIFINPTKAHIYLTNKDTNAWHNLDTINITKEVFNSDTSWEIGALNQTYDNPYSSWGVYDAVSHVVMGDSLYIVKAGSVYRKLWIIKKDYGDWYLRLGSLDNSFDTTFVISNNSYKTKDFVYVNFTNASLIDREPADADWDIVATRYAANLGGGTFYPSTGVLSNVKVKVAKVSNVNKKTYFDYASQSYKSAINAIGYDWKVFDNTNFVYTIPDSLIYFVKAKNGDVYSLYFDFFRMSPAGVIGFSRAKLFTSGINELNNTSTTLSVYPNPANQSLYVLTDAVKSLNHAIVRLVNLNGQIVYENKLGALNGFQSNVIDVQQIPAGLYVLMLENDGQILSQKVQIER